MSTKATKYNTYARNTPYSRSMGFDHYVPTGDEINEAPDSSMMKKPELHTRGGKTAPEPNTTQSAIKKVGQKLKDKFYEDTQINERTIAQKNSMQQRNKDAARARAQQMAKDRIAAKQKAAAPAPQVKQPAPQAAPRPQAQKPIPKAAAPAPQAKPAPQRAQTSVRTRGGGVQSAPKPSGLLSKIGSGIKRVAGGVADAATGNRFDFDKRGGQRPARPAGQAAGGAVVARGGNVRGSGARNRPMQRAAGGAQDALNRNPGQKPRVQDALNRNPGQRPVGTPATSRRPMSPEMQRRVAQTQVGTNAARAVQKLNPRPGQTVTTRQTPQGTTATLTGSAGSLQKNKQKANRVANAANRAGGNVSVGKITGGQGVADF